MDTFGTGRNAGFSTCGAPTLTPDQLTREPGMLGIPDGFRIGDGGQSWTGDDLRLQVEVWQQLLQASAAQRVATLVDNHPHWVALDLAIRGSDRVHVPLPPFFTPTQIQHVLSNAGIDTLVTAQPESFLSQGWRSGLRTTFTPWHILHKAQREPIDLPAGTSLITYTSGTTGAAKGVALSSQHLETVARSLVHAAAATGATRHLCLLPLAVLLEQVGGVLAPLIQGGEIVMPSLASTGVQGAAGVDGRQLLRVLESSGAHSAILLPQMLRALVRVLADGATKPPGLRMLAVGGARVGSALLQAAAELDLPVFEGYGLSECGSVVCLNQVGAQRAGSVGKPLPHCHVRVDASGELHVAGPHFLGYLGSAPIAASTEYATGDLGHIDSDGFVYLSGRRSNVLITAFGRNVAPEWVEAEICAHPAIAQAFVCGDAMPWLAAVLVASAPDSDLVEAIDQVNRSLPDYARIRGWLRAPVPFTCSGGELTSNGRLRRSVLQARYGADISALYASELNLPLSCKEPA